MVIGKVLTIDELMGEYGYEAVFVGSGAGLPRFMGIPGESLNGVYSANEFLTRIQPDEGLSAHQQDPHAAPARRSPSSAAATWPWTLPAAPCVWALRRSTSSTAAAWPSCPPVKEEVEHAEEEGIIFKTLCNPVEILADENGFVKAITCIEMELGEPDASGRRRPIEKKGSEFDHGRGHRHHEPGHQPQPAHPLHHARAWRPTSTAASSPRAMRARPAARACTPAVTP